MNKELEALEKLLDGYSKGMAGRSYYDIIKQALQRLEAIDNAKPSEALVSLNTIRKNLSNKTFRFNLVKLLDIIEKELKRLADIDNANPSEALEDLEKYLFNEWKQNHVNFGCDYKLEAELDKQLNNLASIKQDLIKSQEQEKVLKIIKKKCVGNDNLYLVKTSIKYKQYLGTAKLGIYNIVNINLKENDLLTQEEFDLLKRWLG